MASSSVFITLPSQSLFSFPPNSNPSFITPPPPASIPFAPPIAIPDHIYQAFLDPKVPITIAAVYAVTAKALNAYNKSTGKKPWALSKTRAFGAFVIAHNVFLAVYSAWTWWGMLGALRRSVVSPLGPSGLAGFADSVCKLNGPAGLGNAAFFNEESNSWQTYSSSAALASNGQPSSTDPGRIWNEGLAFYGWIFYLSKFYEVLDTFIILAKGKFSSTLQTYHHAGAMMCMWAGMRYMSAPIWMFAFVNSGIHALMYTYYAVTAFSIRVPMVIKRTLTTMQITQFLVGASYAMAHSFISYAVPAALTRTQKSSPSALASSGAVKEVADQPNTHAERIVPCITTTGATFAIWLNVLYLAPLTYLFVSFFIASYIKRSSAEQKTGGRGGIKARRLSDVATTAEKAGWDAAKGVEREVYGEGSQEAVMEEEDGAALLAANGRAIGKAARANGRALPNSVMRE